MWKCTTCDRQFEAMPEDAVRLTRTKARTNVFRFPDGSIHALRKIRPKSESVPPFQPKTPVEQSELLLEIVQLLDELPKPQPEIKAEPEIEIEDESSMTSMEFAFRRQRNN